MGTERIIKNHMDILWHEYTDAGGEERPVTEASLTEKASIVGRVGIMLLSCGTGAWRVRSSMNTLSEVMGITCTADIGLMSIEYTCFDGEQGFTQSLCLTNTGVNTSKLNRLEHFIREFEKEGCSMSGEQLHQLLDEIERIHGLYSPVALGFAAALACGGFTFLLGGGSTSKKNVGRYTIYTYLKYCGVRSLDYVFISHPDKDHVNGIYELIELCDNTFEIGTVVLPGISWAEAVKKQADDDMSKLERILKNAGINVVYADAGDCIKSGGFSVKCMHPCEGYDYESANDYSAVYLVEYGDFSMLMTGDAEKKAEKCIIEDVNSMTGDAGEPARLVSVNILKVGHHGSKGASSEEFLSYVKPETALISCGAGNSYGHPHTQTLQRLSGIGAKVYRTDESGEIAVHVRDGLYKIEVFKAL